MFTKFARRYLHFLSIINRSIVFLSRLYKFKRPGVNTENQKPGQLIIRFEKGEWILTVYDDNNEIVALEWLETGEFLDEQTMQSYLEKFLEGLYYDPDNVHVVICGEQFQFLPAGFTSENEEWATLINNTDNSIDRLIAEPLGNESGMELIYAVPESLFRILRQVLDRYIFTHQAALFFNEKDNDFPHESVIVCLYRDFVLIQAIVNNETFFLKRITWKTQEDLLFEIMSIFRHFSMDPSEIPLYAGGMITSDSPVFNLLMRYIKEVKIREFASFKLLNQLPDLHQSHLIEKV